MQHDWDILYSFGRKRRRRNGLYKGSGHGVMESDAALVKRAHGMVSENIAAMAIGKHWSVYVTLSFVHTPAL